MSHIEALRVELKESGVPILSEEDVEEDGELDRGAFGIVTKGTLKTDNSIVVIKQMENLIDADDLKLFCKEIKLLARIKHRNIVRLIGVVLDPVSAILERLEFNLNEMNIPQIKGSKKGNNLADLLRFLNRFEVVDEVGVTRGVLHTAAVDVARGLSFLHQNGICHRDLKPANVLVKNSMELFTFKLTDFGEARARDLQTASFPHTSTDRVQRGTEAFFAPEQVLKSLRSANLSDLKRVDIWGYGLIIFCLLSPDLIQPWQVELRSSTVKELMTDEKLPLRSDKYKHLPENTGLGEVFTSCCQYDPARRPAMDDVMSILTKMTDSHKNIGSSASLASAELVPAGDERDIRSESTKEKRKRLVTSEALVDDPSAMNIVSEPTEKQRRRLMTPGASADVPSPVSKPTEEKRALPQSPDMASLNPPRESGHIVRMRVRACYDRLVQNIRVCDHLDYWYQEGVIEMEDKELISARVTENAKVRQALDIILAKPDQQVVDFRASFEREKYCKHIGTMIDQQKIPHLKRE